MILALLVLVVVVSFVIWAVRYLPWHYPPVTPTATIQVTPHPSATPTATTPVTLLLSLYDQFVMKNGIQFGFDTQHSRFNPYESELSPTTVATLVTQFAAATFLGTTLGGNAAAVNLDCPF